MKTFSMAVLGTLIVASCFSCKENNAATTSGKPESIAVIRKDEQEPLIGRYGLLSDGKVVPVLRVVHPPSSQEFVMQEWGVGDWRGAKTVGHPLKAEDLRKLEAAGLPELATGPVFGKMILVKVAKADAAQRSGITGFALLSEIGPHSTDANALILTHDKAACRVAGCPIHDRITVMSGVRDGSRLHQLPTPEIIDHT